MHLIDIDEIIELRCSYILFILRFYSKICTFEIIVSKFKDKILVTYTVTEQDILCRCK